MSDPDHDFHDKLERERRIIAENNKKVLNELKKNDEEVDEYFSHKQYFKEKDEQRKYEEKYLEKANKLRMLVDDYCLFNQIKNELIQDGYNVEVNHERKKVKVYKEI